MSKRKRKTLTLNEKCDIIKELELGKSVTIIAKRFGIGKSTISDIKKSKNKILSFVSSMDNVPGPRKTLRLSNYPQMENHLYQWYLEQKSNNVPLSGDLLCQKAKWFYQNITGNSDFTASAGWLDRFKKRHGIRFTGGHKLPTELPTDNNTIEPEINQLTVKPISFAINCKLQEKIMEMDLVSPQIYIVNVCELFWNILPEKSYEKRQINKKRITFLLCTNACGNHKLKIFVIGNAKNPNQILPVHYNKQKDCLMTKELFNHWFHKEFVPSINEKMKEFNMPQKALLVLNKIPCHLDEEELISEDKNVQTVCLPSNYTSFTQLVEQNVIHNVKLNYRKFAVLSIAKKKEKYFNLPTALCFLNDAWTNVSSHLIEESWKSVWNNMLNSENPECVISEIYNENEELKLLTDICNETFHTDLTTSEISDWALDINEDVRFSDAEKKISHKMAMDCFDTCIKWCMENGVAAHKILILRQLHENASQANAVDGK